MQRIAMLMFLLFTTVPIVSWAASNVIANVPGTGEAITSAPIRNNFATTKSEITALQSHFPGSSTINHIVTWDAAIALKVGTCENLSTGAFLCTVNSATKALSITQSGFGNIAELTGPGGNGVVLQNTGDLNVTADTDLSAITVFQSGAGNIYSFITGAVDGLHADNVGAAVLQCSSNANTALTVNQHGNGAIATMQNGGSAGLSIANDGATTIEPDSVNPGLAVIQSGAGPVARLHNDSVEGLTVRNSGSAFVRGTDNTFDLFIATQDGAAGIARFENTGGAGLSIANNGSTVIASPAGSPALEVVTNSPDNQVAVRGEGHFDQKGTMADVTRIGQKTAVVQCASDPSLTFSSAIPGGSWVLGVTAEPHTIVGPIAYTVGVTDHLAWWGSAIPIARANIPNDYTLTSLPFYPSTTAVFVTFNSSCTSGSVGLTVHYLTILSSAS